MKNIIFLLSTLCFFVSCNSKAQQQKSNKTYTVVKTKAEWKKALTPIQYYVLRESGTEKPNSSKYTYFKAKGTFVCAGCNTPLYKSERKYDSGSGWPSFDQAIEKNIETDIDYKIGYARTELKCNTCGGHLGHRFNDGPKETTGIRDCINGVALEFIPSKK